MEIRGKSAIVPGAGNGIGRASTLVLPGWKPRLCWSCGFLSQGHGGLGQSVPRRTRLLSGRQIPRETRIVLRTSGNLAIFAQNV